MSARTKLMILIVMGVSGSGKSTVGKLLADKLGYRFADGDDYHSPANKAKMSTGHALTDADRIPWLLSIKESFASLAPAVIACSALKQEYRRLLGVEREKELKITFIYLKLSKEEARRRLTSRTGHFFKESLLDSQFETLEEPQTGEDPSYRVVTFEAENGQKTPQELASLIASRISGLG